MAALTLTAENYYDKVLGAWQGKSAGVTLGAGMRGQLTPGRYNYYSPVPGQPVASLALDFPLVWLAALEECGPEITPADLAVAWLEHLDYPQDEFGYAALNLRRGVPPPASGSYANWFRHATGGVLRADLWAMLAPGAPQVAAAYAYHDAKLDHSEEGVWAAMFLAAVGSAAFFLNDAFTLMTIGLAMIPKTCRTARAVKTALAAAGRGASWLEARESVQHEVGHKNFTDAPQNIGFFTIGLLYGMRDFGAALCAACNCGYDAEVVGGALGAILGIRDGSTGLPDDWLRPIGDVVIPGNGLRDFDAPHTLHEVASRTVAIGKEFVAARCPDIAIVSAADMLPAFASEFEPMQPAGEARIERVEPDTVEAPATLPEPEKSTSPTVEAAPEENALPESAPAPTAEPRPSEVLPGFAPQQPVFQPFVAAPAATLPGFVTPQSVVDSAEAPMPTAIAGEGSETSLDAGIGGEAPASLSESQIEKPRIAPDPVSAIAWADNALVKPLLVTPPNALIGHNGDFEVVLDTGDAPAIAYNTPKMLSFAIFNRGEAFSGRIALLAPSGWQVQAPSGLGQRQYIAAHTGIVRLEFTLAVPADGARIDIANTVSLRLAPDDGGVPVEIDFQLMGASCWWTVGAFTNFDGEGFDRTFAPEDRPGLSESYVGRSSQQVRWERHSFLEPTLDLEPLFRGGSGVCYGQTLLQSPTPRDIRLVANTNSGVKVWLNGSLIMRRFHRETFRPVLGDGPWAKDVTLRAGGNALLIKWVRGTEPYEFSLTTSDRSGRGLPEVGNTTW
jgi:ADP-ribosylglycohydrolase